MLAPRLELMRSPLPYAILTALCDNDRATVSEAGVEQVETPIPQIRQQILPKFEPLVLVQIRGPAKPLEELSDGRLAQRPDAHAMQHMA
eukprot:scaffold1804_cov263-Pinguiococcus_pyrenoidosus.AAC.31